MINGKLVEKSTYTFCKKKNEINRCFNGLCEENMLCYTKCISNTIYCYT